MSSRRKAMAPVNIQRRSSTSTNFVGFLQALAEENINPE